jgi:ferredoxin
VARPVWFVPLLKRLFPERINFAKLTHLPFVRELVNHGLFEGDEVIYLPQDNSIKVKEPIEDYGDMILPSQVVDYFIERSNYCWIMNFCICRESCGCQDYPIEFGCLFLGEAVLGIRPEYGRLVSRDQAFEHVARCREAGLVHLIGRNKLDTVWLGVGPGDKLLTICNCCPCCCLWRMLPHLSPLISRKITSMPGVSVIVNDLCVGCGTCAQDEVCFVGAVHVENGQASIDDQCLGCGRCVDSCPNGAIELSIPNANHFRQSVDRISTLVDIS